MFSSNRKKKKKFKLEQYIILGDQCLTRYIKMNIN